MDTAFEQFLIQQNAKIPLQEFVLDLALTFLLAYALRVLYVRYGSSLSSRERFGNNFPVIALTTMIIITVVKSSLALSLGLVGALSIVRFRTAIKDPEELSYLFITIAIGLGFGASQRVVTLVGFTLLAGAILLRNRQRRASESRSTVLTVSADRWGRSSLEQIAAVLQEHCSLVDLRRLDEADERLEAVFVVEFEGFDALQRAREALAEGDDSVRVHLLDGALVS